MKCFVGIGSNVGDRRAHLERAARALRELPGASGLRFSPVFRTPALVPPGAPEGWRLPFLNAAAELEWSGEPRALLRALKDAEIRLGREPAPPWAPRVIDLDLLACEGATLNEHDCKVPHPALPGRAFVLDPLKHLAPGFRIPSLSCTTLELSRRLPARAPLWLAIFNLTPDSFSDGRALEPAEALRARLEALERAEVQCLDLGAESTRPGAAPVTEHEEWARLAPSFDFLAERYRGLAFRPRLSVDTRRASVAAKALERGASLVNDVSGLSDPAMPELLKSSACDYVLMHNLGVPADRAVTLPLETDPVEEVLRWARGKLELLDKAGVSLHRVLFDPGIGFGKTPSQNVALLRHAEAFLQLPVRVLFGHSRKSFHAAWGPQPVHERDGYGIGASLVLAGKGIEVLRVHEAHLHATAHHAQQELHDAQA